MLTGFFMKKSNLVSILRTFDKKEVREFRKWLHSPAHNQRQDVIDLYEYLMSGKHLTVDKFLAKERVFKAIFPQRTYSDSEIRQCMHFLFKAVESFLAYQELLKDQVRTQTMLAKMYRKRQLPKLFKKAMDASQKTQEQQPFRDTQYYENEYAFQFEQYNFLSATVRDVQLNLQEVSDANDIAYLTSKLKLSCIMLSHQAVYKSDYKMHLLEDVLSNIEQNPKYLEIPAISIYYYIYRSISEKKDEEAFVKLKEQILQNSDLFPLDEIRGIYLLAINFCIGQINTGKVHYSKESFDLYDLGTRNRIFIENGIMNHFTFSNAISAALYLEKYAWVDSFITEYSPLLEDKHQYNYVRFYRARLNFEKKEYAEAMKLLAQSDFDDILMTLSAKVILLKMYYEQDEYDSLEWLLASMNIYLQRKKIMGYHKTNYKNIIAATKKLLKIFPASKEKKEKLKNEIHATSPLTEKKWLLEQLDKF